MMTREELENGRVAFTYLTNFGKVCAIQVQDWDDAGNPIVRFVAGGPLTPWDLRKIHPSRKAAIRASIADKN